MLSDNLIKSLKDGVHIFNGHRGEKVEHTVKDKIIRKTITWHTGNTSIFFEENFDADGKPHGYTKSWHNNGTISTEEYNIHGVNIYYCEYNEFGELEYVEGIKNTISCNRSKLSDIIIKTK